MFNVGTLEQYDQAVSKCEILLHRLEEKRAKTVEKETSLKEQKKKKKNKSSKKAGNEPDVKALKASNKKQPHKSEIKSREWQTDQDQSVPAPLQALQEMAGDIAVVGQKRKINDTSPVKTDADGFKVPPPPGFKPKMPRLESPAKSHANVTSTISRPVEPPPGYRGKSEASCEAAEPCQKQIPNESTEMAEVSEAKNKAETSHHNCTVFVSNLDYQITEEKLKDVFSEVGEMKQVRLVTNFKGLSKGYAYVEFIDEFLAAKALDWDRKEIDGRPMFVSPFEEKGNKTKKFKYSTGLEKNKLFIKGLPFTMSKEALENMFKQHGTLKSIRLVTYRNGYSKGLAYIEYENETDAAQAILKTDQLQVGENTISVAISHPPERKTPLSQRESIVPSLGGGKRETAERGKARTQLSLVPRSLQRVGGQKEKPKSTLSKVSESTSNGSIQLGSSPSETGDKKSNEDFRNMLLKKT
ncbi:hypothetical protein LSH36_641g00030 [Paralvinella palmiformis]|uniref:RRM domain-containing protein n=1 Tax=Paralvinella palmiformis TaxID=53620 RepID=A0AAD9J4N9_9ANNE|nr:hypothetical protein LSH36_641g00030 [Paralvinella palmiformis]